MVGDYLGGSKGEYVPLPLPMGRTLPMWLPLGDSYAPASVFIFCQALLDNNQVPRQAKNPCRTNGRGFLGCGLLVEAHNLEILGHLWVKASLVCLWELYGKFLGVYALASA